MMKLLAPAWGHGTEGTDMKCLIVFPANTALDKMCPRCGGEAGDHPAASALLPDSEISVHDRPTLREVLGR